MLDLLCVQRLQMRHRIGSTRQHCNGGMWLSGKG